MKFIRRVAVIAVAMCAMGLAWHIVREINYQAGLMAFQRGDYRAARLILRSFARDGRLEAEHAMGMMELVERRAVLMAPAIQPAPASMPASTVVATVREAPLPVLKMAADPAMQSLEFGLRDLSGKDSSRQGLDVRL